MKKQIIAVDFDDVLANSTETLRLRVNERLGVNLSVEHYRRPDDYHGYYERLWRDHGLEGKISMEELEPEMITDQSHVLPHTKALETLKVLAKRYELIVVTARNVGWQVATEVWLSRNFPELFSAVVFAGNSEGIIPSKGRLCVENGAVWLIDDNVEHALSALELGVQAILFGEYGWHHKAPDHLIRCKDWAAVGGSISMDEVEPDFRRRVEALVAQIPRGRVMTYGQIAALCGNARAARIVGGIAHFGDPDLPWQRVVNKQGGLAAGYPGGRSGHQQVLEAEGFTVHEHKVDVTRLIWWPEGTESTEASGQTLRLL